MQKIHQPWLKANKKCQAKIQVKPSQRR